MPNNEILFFSVNLCPKFRYLFGTSIGESDVILNPILNHVTSFPTPPADELPSFDSSPDDHRPPANSPIPRALPVSDPGFQLRLSPVFAYSRLHTYAISAMGRVFVCPSI